MKPEQPVAERQNTNERKSQSDMRQEKKRKEGKTKEKREGERDKMEAIQ